MLRRGKTAVFDTRVLADQLIDFIKSSNVVPSIIVDYVRTLLMTRIMKMMSGRLCEQKLLVSMKKESCSFGISIILR